MLLETTSTKGAMVTLRTGITSSSHAIHSALFLWSMIGISSIETATDEDFWTSLLHEDLTQPFGLWLYDNLPMVPMGCKEW